MTDGLDHPEQPIPTGGASTGGRAGSRMALLAALNASRFAIFLVVGLLMTPMMLGAFGTAMWGLFAFVSVCRFPFQEVLQPVVTRELSGAWSRSDPVGRRAAFSNAVALSLLAAVLGIGLTILAVPAVLNGLNFPEGQRDSMRLIVLGEGALLVMMLGCGAWVNIFLAAHRLQENNIHRTFERVQDLIALVPALYLLPIAPEHRLAAFLALRVILRAAHLIVCWWRARLVEPDARFEWRLVTRAGLLHSVRNLGWATSIPISNQVFWMVDHYLLNRFFGPLFNGVYQLTQQLRGYARILGGAITFGAEGITADLAARGHTDALRRLVLTSMRVTASVTAVCTVLLAVFGGALMEAWLGKQLAADEDLKAAGVTVPEAIRLCWTYYLILAPGIVVTEAGYAATTILFGMGMVKRFAPALLLMTALKLALTWSALSATTGGFDTYHVLLTAWVTLGLSLSMFGVYLPIIVKRAVGVGLREQYRRVYLRPILSTAPVALLGWLMAEYLGPWTPGMWSMTKLGACVLVLLGVWAAVAAWMIPEGDERERVRGMRNKLMGKVLRKQQRSEAAEQQS
ncbi:MAG: lipopolysaccharide biosynthesis protein [Phycisphaerales bacterium]